MQRLSRTFAAAALVLLAGAGCLGGGEATTGTGGLWTSTDGGTAWTQLTALPSAAGVGSIAPVDVMAIEIDPSDESAWYLGTTENGVFYSLDSGASWQRPEDNEARNGTVYDIEVDPRNVCTYYVLKSTRVLKTTTCGREFDTESYVETRSEKLTNLVIDWYNPNNVYITTTAGDVIRSSDGGQTWSKLYTVNDEIIDFAVSNADSRVLLIGGKRHGLVRSADGGVNWVELGDDLKDEFSKSDDVYGFAQSADGDVLYMTSEYGLLKSTDAGATWEGVPLLTSEGEVDIRAIAVSPSDADTVVYGTHNTFYLSTTGGQPWVTKKLPTTRAANVLRVTDDSTVLLGTLTIED